MLPDEVWSSFLRARGVELSTAAVGRLEGGEVNRNWAISDELGHRWVLRHYQVTLDPAEVTCELAVVDRLAAHGFPTPPPIPDASGRLFDIIDGQPAALFNRASGTHPSQRQGGYGSLDLALGEQAAALAARLHRALNGTALPGHRSPDRDPWRQLGHFLDDAVAGHQLFAGVSEQLTQAHAQLAPIYSDPSAMMPTGIVHYDLTPNNLLLDPSGAVSAVLDFDDCAHTLLAYELGPIAIAFGTDDHRRADPDRLAALIAAYDTVRPLTRAEQQQLPDLLAVHAAAEGVGVLTGWLRAGRQVDEPTESFSMQTFLDITSNRRGVRNALSGRTS